MVHRYVYDVYSTIEEAETHADQLVGKGVPQKSISLAANESILHNYQSKYHLIPSADAIDDRNWFQKLLGLEEEREPLESEDFTDYEDSLHGNQVLLIVDSEYEGMLGESGHSRDRANRDSMTGEYPDTIHDEAPPTSPLSHDRPLVDDALTGEAVTGAGMDGRIDPLTRPDAMMDGEGERPK